MATLTKKQKRIKRHYHIRKRISGTEACPRLAVFKTAKHIYAQIINDTMGLTLAASSTLDAKVCSEIKEKNKSEVATIIGKNIAADILKKGIKTIVFDRGGFKYHGRVKALADAAREMGLKF